MVLFVTDWKLALLSLVTLPIGMFAMIVMFQIGAKDMDHYYMSARKMNNTIIEYINGMEVVKVFNRDGWRKTLLVIAHRLNTIASADALLVVENENLCF